MNNLQLITNKFNEAGGLPLLPKIKNDNDFGLASDSYAFLNKYFLAAEKKRKEDVTSLIEQKREIDNNYKQFTNPLEKTMTEIKKLMVEYSCLQQEAQKLLEAEAITAATINGDDSVIVEALDVTKNQAEFSSSNLNEITKFKFKINNLNQVIEIPTMKFKTYLESNLMPDFIESYKEAQITIRKKF